jgi:hypothetical protein
VSDYGPGQMGKLLPISFVWVKAPRKLGEMLVAAKAAGQITHAHTNPNTHKRVVPDGNNPSFTLEEAGIDRKRVLSVLAGLKPRNLRKTLFFGQHEALPASVKLVQGNFALDKTALQLLQGIFGHTQYLPVACGPL